MRLKIDVMERECKNLEFGREVNMPSHARKTHKIFLLLAVCGRRPLRVCLVAFVKFFGSIIIFFVCIWQLVSNH
jgi:hypothetical protein